MDLSATERNLLASQHGDFQAAQIYVGGQARIVTPNDLLTPAEFMALQQVLLQGQQHIKVGVMGNATGGRVDLSSISQQAIANLVVPKRVTAVHDFAHSGALNVLGTLSNSGRFFAYSTSASVNTAYINANSITNMGGATLSSILPAGGLPGVMSAIESINLNLTAVHDIVNQGTISSSGSLNLTAGGAIINSAAVAATVSTSVMQAVSNINLSSALGTIVNSGLINAATGNLRVDSIMQQTLQIDNRRGTLQALLGKIDLGNGSSASKSGIVANGGNFLAQEINFNGGNGSVEVIAQRMEGLVNVTGHQIAIAADTPTFNLGSVTATGDPLFSNSTDFIISSNIATNGNPLSIIAGRNILVSGNNRQVRTDNNAGNGGDILMVAGAAFNTSGGTLTITGGTTTGGYIDLFEDSTNELGRLSSDSTSSNGSGGDITLIAYKGTLTGSGTIELPDDLTVKSSGEGTGSNGDFTVIADGANRTISPGNSYSIFLGRLEVGGVAGSGGGGNITLLTATPVITGGSLQINTTTGAVTSGSFTASTTLANSSVRLDKTDTNGGDLTIKAGKDIFVNGAALNMSRQVGTGSGGDMVIVAESGNFDTDGGRLTTNGNSGSGGAITITAGGNISHGDMNADAGGNGDGGSIVETAGGDMIVSTYTVDAAGLTGDNDGGLIKLVAQGDLSVSNTASADGTGTGNGGTIIMHGFDIFVESGTHTIHADALGTGDGGSICLIETDPNGSLTIGSGALTFQLSATGLGIGADGGTISVIAGNLIVESWGALSVAGTVNPGSLSFMSQGNFSYTGASTGINLTPVVSGNGGNFSLIAGGSISLNTAGLGIVSNGAGTNGNGGSITVKSGGSLTLTNTNVTANGSGSGSGGTITLSGGNGSATLNIDTENCNCSITFAGGSGSANTFIDGNVTANGGTTGNGGTITLQTTSTTRFDIEVGETASGVDGTVSSRGGITSGNGGTVSVQNFAAGGLLLAALANVSVNTTSGNGGNITLDAGAGVNDGVLTLPSGTFSANAAGSGAKLGGTITLNASSLNITSGTVPKVLRLTAQGADTGRGGTLALTTTSSTYDITVDDVNDAVTLDARSGANGGNGGTLAVSSGRNLTVDGNDVLANPRGTNGNGAIVLLTAGTAAAGILTFTSSLSANSNGTGTGGTITLTSTSVAGSSVVIPNGISITAQTSGGNVTVSARTLTNNGTITASNASGGFASITSSASLAYGGTGTVNLQGTGSGSITVSVSGSNSITFTGSQTFNPASTGSLQLQAQAAGGAIRFDDSSQTTVQSGVTITISTPNIAIGNNSLVNATAASPYIVNSGGGANSLTMTVDNGESGEWRTTGGTFAITPTSGQSLTFAKTSGATLSTINLNGGTITTTTNAATSINSLVKLSTDNEITLNVNASTFTNNGTLTSTADDTTVTIQSNAGLTLAGTGTVTATGGGFPFITLSASGANTLLLNGDQTYDPNDGLVVLSASSNGGAVEIANNRTLSQPSGHSLNITAPTVKLGNLSTVSAVVDNFIFIASGCTDCDLNVVAPSGSSATIDSAGADIYIWASGDSQAINFNKSSTTAATLNINGGYVQTQTWYSNQTISSGFTLSTNGDLEMQIFGGGTLTDNGTITSSKAAGTLWLNGAFGDFVMNGTPSAVSQTGGGAAIIKVDGDNLTINSDYDFNAGISGNVFISSGSINNSLTLGANVRVRATGGGQIGLFSNNFHLGAGSSIVGTKTTGTAVGISGGTGQLNMNLPVGSSVTVSTSGGIIDLSSRDIAFAVTGGTGSSTINFNNVRTNIRTDSGNQTIGSGVTVSSNNYLHFEPNGTSTVTVNGTINALQLDIVGQTLTLSGSPQTLTASHANGIQVIAFNGLTINSSYTFDPGNNRTVVLSAAAGNIITLAAGKTVSVLGGGILVLGTQELLLGSASMLSVAKTTGTGIILRTPNTNMVLALPGSASATIETSGSAINISPIGGGNSITFSRSQGSGDATFNLNGGPVGVSTDFATITIGSNVIVTSNNAITLDALNSGVANFGIVSASGGLTVNTPNLNNAGTLTAGSNTLTVSNPGGLSIVGSGSLNANVVSIMASGGGMVTAAQGMLSGTFTGTAGAYDVTIASGGLTVGNINSTKGSLHITVGSGTLSVAAGSTVDANEGSLILQNTSNSGTINVGANSTLRAYTITTNMLLGNVFVVVGDIPAPEVDNSMPANVEVHESAGGKVYFGPQNITASASNNVLNAIARKIVFYRSSSGTIHLGGGVTIIADPPIPGVQVFFAKPIRTFAAPVTLVPEATPGLIAPAISNSYSTIGTGAFTQPLMPSVVTDTRPSNLPASAPTVQPSEDLIEEHNQEEDLSLQPIAYNEGTSGMRVIKMADSVVRHGGRAKFQLDESGLITFTSGEALISASGYTKLRAGNYDVCLDPGTSVLISKDKEYLKVCNVYEDSGHSIQVASRDRSVTIAAGQEILIPLTEKNALAALSPDGIGRRRLRTLTLNHNSRVVFSEVSLVSVLRNSNTLSLLFKSSTKADQYLANKFTKMAACLMLATNSHGAYSTGYTLSMRNEKSP